jgi:hypothetical protein
MGPTNHLPGTIFSSSPHGILTRLLHARGPELLPLLTMQLMMPRPRPQLHLGRPHPIGAWPWHPRRERRTELRRWRLTSLNLQRLDPLLGGCGGPTGVGRDGRHGAIASLMHPWEGGIDGEIDRGVWLAPPDSGMEFDSGAMHANRVFLPTGRFIPLRSGKGIPQRYKWYTAIYRSNSNSKSKSPVQTVPRGIPRYK